MTRYPATCTAQLPNAGKSAGKEEYQTYLKEGNIGKAESEEVVPVETEQKSQVTLDSVGRTLEAYASWGARNMSSAGLQGEPSPKSFTSPNLHPAWQLL